MRFAQVELDRIGDAVRASFLYSDDELGLDNGLGLERLSPANLPSWVALEVCCDYAAPEDEIADYDIDALYEKLVSMSYAERADLMRSLPLWHENMFHYPIDG